MRPPKVDDQTLVRSLFSVLRSKGYDGASLSELAAASGLQKASLYHRFPGGKKEITEVVLQFVGDFVEKNIYQVLIDERVEPAARLKLALRNINGIYEGGDKDCILRTLAMDTSVAYFGASIKTIMARWIEGFKKLGVALGFDVKEASEIAIESFVLIQGGLVVSHGMSSKRVYKRSLEFVEKLYLG